MTGSWGPITPQTPYAIFETGALPDGIVWMNLRQFRNGDFFRHMRFYRRQNDRWIWVLPDAAFWSGKTAVVTTGDAGTIGPITIGHPIEDAPVIGAVFDRFAHAYQDLCESLKCPPPIDRTHLWTPGLTLSITIQPLLMQPLVQDHLGLLQIDLPSPQVVGYYENVNTPGDPYDAMAYATLIAPVARLASGDYARWESDHGGELFLQAIVVWEQTHLAEEIQPLSLFYPTTFSPPAVPQIISWQPSVTLRKYYSDLLRDEFPLPLGSLWGWFGQGDRVGSLQHVAINEAEAAVAFIDERYGEEYVVRFLNALGRAHSLDEALGAALSVSFEEFNREWAKWIAGE